ncbi:MAG: HAD family hydrolase [Gemmatimonadaceae bacterium]
MRLDCVLFEIEGILVETVSARREAFEAALHGGGISVDAAVVDAAFAEAGDATFDQLTEALSRHSGNTVDLTDAALLALRAERAYASLLATGVTLVPGARDYLDELSARVRLGVVTRASRQVARQVLELADLGTAMVLVASDDAVPPKPSPRPYTLALSRLARRGQPGRPPRVVALEDGPCGAAAAAAAAIPCVVVTTGTATDAGTVNAAMVNAAMTGAGRATMIRSSLDEVKWETLAAMAGEPVETAR